VSLARSELPPDMASNAEYTIGLQQMANYPANTRAVINLGKWQQQLSEVQ